jgi:hypothetical protein
MTSNAGVVIYQFSDYPEGCFTHAQDSIIVQFTDDDDLGQSGITGIRVPKPPRNKPPLIAQCSLKKE